jgi:hypothetical protein
MKKKYIHINQHVIRKNGKTGEREPVVSVKSGKTNRYCHEVSILDNNRNILATVVYNPDKPLSCGAKVWIETYQDVLLENRSYK